ncbi:MAG: hypothetical protein DME19_15310 [Verrucomicrobia bacterium]|nr:MAG: hypothetical protein DME19_15310 [Verrucomicrobiota bacterium]
MSKITFLSSLFSMTDEQAMGRVQAQDDPRAFARLVERWEEPIRRLCARMTGDPHRGEDLKQDTFARVFEKRKSFRPTARFSTWLWRIALNLCYDELRRINRRGESPLDADENATVSELRGSCRTFIAARWCCGITRISSCARLPKFWRFPKAPSTHALRKVLCS